MNTIEQGVRRPQRVGTGQEIRQKLKVRPWFSWNEWLGLEICPYLRRWLFNPRLFSLRLHHWLGSDDHRAKHDHSWCFVTLVLWGGYTDISEVDGKEVREEMTPGCIRYRPATHRHTVEVHPGGCWTLVITGPVVRKWGFWVEGKFWKAHKYFFEYGHHPCD